MKLDYFQEKSIEYVKKGNSLMVCAPTGAGKTLIAEELIKHCLRNGEGVIYTAPIKALSNQKYRDFVEGFGHENVGIITGDVSINPASKIIIMTTEIFRNHILQSPKKLEDKTWVIFDEIHYLDDMERGTVWEESLVMLPQHMNFLALSATVPNAVQIVEWLKNVLHKPVKLVVHLKRPVPLSFYFQCHNKIVSDFKKLEYIFKKMPLYRFKPNRVVDLVRHLQDSGRLPCIYFSFLLRDR